MTTIDEPEEPRILGSGFTNGPHSPTDKYNVSDNAYRYLTYQAKLTDSDVEEAPDINILNGVDIEAALTELTSHDPPLLKMGETTTGGATRISVTLEGWDYHHRHIADTPD